MSVRVGSGAWAAARAAWLDLATTSSRALIAHRAAAARRPGARHVALGPGTHPVPQRGADGWVPFDVKAPWPPGRSHRRPILPQRHVIDGLFDDEDCARLAAAAAGLEILRAADGEASVAALGDVGASVLGTEAHALMKNLLRTMTSAARGAMMTDDGDGDGAREPGVGQTTDPERGTGGGRERGLFPVGGLLTHIVPGTTEGRDGRKRASGATRVVDPVTGDAHGYWSAHVDKANVPEYDVSAVLYLSTGAPPQPGAATGEDGEGTQRGGTHFTGGAFTFMDAEGDGVGGVGGVGVSAVVTPRRGRLIVFSSGEENVHAVGRVTSGARATLNLWLTADPRVAAEDDDLIVTGGRRG